MPSSTLPAQGSRASTASCRRRLALLWLPLALAGCLAAAGCSGDDDDDDSTTSDVESIVIKEEHDWSDDENDYAWTSPGPVARVSLEIKDFHHGDVLITIYDAVGDIIFQKLYWSFDWYWYIDGEYEDLDFTESGAPGEWTIVLEYSEFTGDVRLEVETTEDVPEEPVVPPPTDDSDLLDQSFGNDGRAEYEPDLAGGRRLAVDSTGRIVVCGTRIDAEGARRLSVWRYTASGALDTTFGSGGVYTFDDAAYPASGGFDVAVDSINRILVSGWTMAPGVMRTDLLLLRLTVGGALDVGFDSDGIATFDDGEDEIGTGVALDSIGRVLVAGTSRNADNTLGHMLLLRFDFTGLPDGSFDGDGVLQSGDASDRGLDLAIDASDQPLVLGLRNANMILWRFQTNGFPDAGFGNAGVVISPGDTGEFRVGLALALKSDGSIGVSGVRYFDNQVDPPELVIWRYLSNGAPLTVFGGGGLVAYRHPNGWAAGRGIGFDSNGRILVCGTTRTIGASESDASATLWRYYSTGAAETTLPGSNGTGVARFDPRPDDAGTGASSMAILGDGKVVATGSAFSRSTNALDLIVWRLAP